ncbi:pre-mRNA-splicing regulator female-lethal(2)D isoform X1 [Planococcus citri]|uniref:pre-mRNA-splicing regulator female-lethal(2)D isoform X1 n=1 Tax=Planococcus citri TaxID=170843 RepID=UPI0031F78B6A
MAVDTSETTETVPPPIEDTSPAVVKEEPQNTEKPSESPTNEVIKEPFENRGIELIHDEETLNNMTKEELMDVYKNSITYINSVETKLANFEAEILSLKNTADYQKQRDPSYREKVLLRKLAMKEQEIQEFASQISELKASQITSLTTLKSSLLDPAVNIIIQKLKNELSATKASLEETQNELNAWKFTPDSNTGKRLMAKCRLLHQENEELGKMISSGRVAKLEGELALQKSFSEEVKKSQYELDELLQDLDEDVEGMQGTIYYLQQELKKSKEKIADLNSKNIELKNLLNGNVSENDTEKKSKTEQSFNQEDESSNDSACLILKVNPEEEYDTMLNIDEIKQESESDYKNKRNADDVKTVPLKKQKRMNLSPEYQEKVKKEPDE